jgi:DHA1 family bicyclomycin/chloramphenicol resistance-like MFS transporter
MLYKEISEKPSEFLLLGIITLMFIAMCAETDMYVPAFPEMVTYFATTEDKIQLILSLNFAGLCVASLICGPLSDSFGRRKVLLMGLLSFFVSSLGCIFAQNFTTMLSWRFIQGMSASVPMVVAFAIFLDKYSLGKASQFIGIINSVISSAMAGAPVLGAWLSSTFHWRLNFVIIAILVFLSLIGTWFFIDESLPKERRTKFNLIAILKDYGSLLSNFKFMGYTFIVLLPITGVVVYVSNLSLIFINHLGISTSDFGFYQAPTMASYLVFSALSAKLIAKKGPDHTKNLGGIITLIGGAALFGTALYSPTSPVLICLSMAIFAAGGSLMVGVFAMKALEIFPDIKGTASSMNVAIRQLLAFLVVFISELTFDGTILPVATLLFIYMCIALIWYIAIEGTRRVAANIG